MSVSLQSRVLLPDLSPDSTYVARVLTAGQQGELEQVVFSTPEVGNIGGGGEEGDSEGGYS